MTWRCKINGYTKIFGLKETDKLKNTVYDGDLWRRYRDRQNAMARARRKAIKNDIIDLEAGGTKLNQRYKKELIKRMDRLGDEWTK